MPLLTHLVSLAGPAGVELQFAELVNRAAVRHPDWRHLWLNPAAPMHPLIAEHMGAGLAGMVRTKCRFGIRLPAKPVALRAWHCHRELARWRADVVVIWNRSARIAFLLEAAGERRCIHYEHGAAWFGGREAERRDYFRRVPAAICNSRAAARVLEQIWRYGGAVRVVPNALRPTLAPAEIPPARSFPQTRPFRLGAAARLVPVKGLPLVLHALRELRARGLDAELHVAGAGPERERLGRLADRLGIAESVRFLGPVERMGEFYSTIDCLVHAPVTEAFGLVGIEAGAHACPAIVASVDGLPEAVAHATSGLCLEPSLPLADYVELGGTLAGMPPLVFDPATDAVVAPRVVAPTDLADAVESLAASPQRFEALSGTAARHVADNFGFDRYVDAFLSAVASFTSRGG